MRILITGSNGLLGQKIVRQLLKRKITFLATSQGLNRNPDCPEKFFQAVDITNNIEVDKVFTAFKPTVIIHTAAMTNVDACELNPNDCEKINVSGTENCFDSAQKLNAQFVLLSTDFVFDGKKGPYAEEDRRNPLSIYANSKVKAEDILFQSEYQNWAILRTIIVFGQGNNLSRSNIVLWAHEALTKQEQITIVDDQYRAPTWADDLAWACIQTACLKANGVFHIAGPETLSIHELVLRIARHFKLDASCVKPIQSTNLNQAAKRPPKTGFVLKKAREILGYNPKTLEQSLDLLKFTSSD